MKRHRGLAGAAESASSDQPQKGSQPATLTRLMDKSTLRDATLARRMSQDHCAAERRNP